MSMPAHEGLYQSWDTRTVEQEVVFPQGPPDRELPKIESGLSRT
jgi:hypothetical protein